ncbi:MAG TPA: hypothetical protein VK179_00525 [Bacteroidales bacterium]|nr:hypothetical protein [Bacteroidales bacterium]
MKKILSLVIVSVCISSAIQAQLASPDQEAWDAIKFSQNFPTLSARSLSMGGAFSSLGGDFSSSYINPAGLGLYRKSEFVFSPYLGLSTTKANYLGETNTDYKYQFSLSNIGYVGTFITNKEKGLVSASYALGYNRINNFNNRVNIVGTNERTSLIDYFMNPGGNNINGTDPEDLDPFTNRLAFDAYLIDTTAGTNFEYTTPVMYRNQQRRIIESRGGTGQWNFAFGLNFNNIWYVGAGLGINQISYETQMSHTEINRDPAESDFANFTYTEKEVVNGHGINFNFGTMVRLFEIVRLGASFQTPTFYRLDESYKNSMYSEFKSGFVPTDDLGEIYANGEYSYRMATPMKLQAGASIQLGKMGIISSDIEFLDYSKIHFKSIDDPSFEDNNDFLPDMYGKVVNFKIGGEARFDNLFVRLGGGLYQNPYATSDLTRFYGKNNTSELTAGFGFRTSSFFFDLGFSSLSNKKDKYLLYSAYDPRSTNDLIDNVSTINQNRFRFVASLGFRF